MDLRMTLQKLTSKDPTAIKPSTLKAVSCDVPTDKGGGRRCLLAKDGKGHGEAP